MFSVIDQSRVIALKLSNNHSNEQINQLFDDSLNSLRFLTLDIVNMLTIKSIFSRDNISKHLESLSIWFDADQYRDKVSLSSAWILKVCSSHLKSLKYLSIRKHNEHDERREAAIDTSLSRLMLKKLPWQHLCLTAVRINRLGIILSHLPELQTLNSVAQLNSSNFVCPKMLCLHRCTLKLVWTNFETIVDFLTHCPNLQRLSLSMVSVYIDVLDDQQWQNVIERHLPKLKWFKITMRTEPLAMNEAEPLCTTSFQKDSFWQERKTCVTVFKRPSYPPTTVQVHISIQFNISTK
jgi:hypothetical protein